MGLGPRDHIHLLESTVIDVIRNYGVHGIATRDPGVWTMPPKERYAKYLSSESSWSTEESTSGSDLLPRKIASVGVHLRQYISSYGIALNVTQEPMWFFRQIVACGLEGRQATSLEGEGVNGVSVDEVAERFVKSFVKRFNAEDPGWSRRPRIEEVYKYDMQDLHPRLSIIPRWMPVSFSSRVEKEPDNPAEQQQQFPGQQPPNEHTTIIRKYPSQGHVESQQQSPSQQAPTEDTGILRKYAAHGPAERATGTRQQTGVQATSILRKVMGPGLPGSKADMRLRAPFEGSILRKQPPMVFLSRESLGSSDGAAAAVQQTMPLLESIIDAGDDASHSALQESVALLPREFIAPGDATSRPEKPNIRPKEVGRRVNRLAKWGWRTLTVRKVRAGSSPPSIRAAAESGGRSRLKYVDRDSLVRKYPAGNSQLRKVEIGRDMVRPYFVE
jgi:hypothetical protein